MTYQNNRNRKYETGDIEAAIELLCMGKGECTPYEVADIIGVARGGQATRMILDVASYLEYRIERHSSQYIIYDW